jgi:hypothetical protein
LIRLPQDDQSAQFGGVITIHRLLLTFILFRSMISYGQADTRLHSDQVAYGYRSALDRFQECGLDLQPHNTW